MLEIDTEFCTIISVQMYFCKTMNIIAIWNS